MFNWFKKKNKNKGFTSTKNLDSENPLLDFLQQETTRIMDEADEKKAPNKIQKDIRKKFSKFSKVKSKNDSDPKAKFLQHLQKSLKNALGKKLNQNLNVKDKYLLGYIYGLCDYTNDLHDLDNEINGIGTFMEMHMFFFKNVDPGDLGSIMGMTGKLSSSGDKTFLEGAIDGGRALGSEKISSEPPKKAYSKLVSHLS